MDKSVVIPYAVYHKGILKEEFLPWLDVNFHIFTAFHREIEAVWNLGYRRYSGRTIVEYLRHHTRLTQRDDTAYKISDHYTPDMVRLYVLLHPEKVDAFKYNRGDNFKEYLKNKPI